MELVTSVYSNKDLSNMNNLNDGYEYKEIFVHEAYDIFGENTVNDLLKKESETAVKLANMCGAVACSRYSNKNWCYDSIEKLTRNGLKQVNIHILLSAETLPWVYETIEDAKTDPRLAGLNAIVFLSLKQKGRGVHFNRVSQEQYKEVVDKCFSTGISFGFDSCQGAAFLKTIKDRPDYKKIEQSVDPCESTRFSMYANARGDFFPCSFMEGVPGWEDGLSIAEAKTFEEIWTHPRTEEFRKKCVECLNNKIGCQYYDIMQRVI